MCAHVHAKNILCKIKYTVYFIYLMKYAMYVYGALTAPNPERIPIIVTPITPTLLIGCSIENIPEIKVHSC